MTQIPRKQKHLENKAIRKNSKKKMIHKLNQTVNQIAQKTFDSGQFDKTQSFYSKSMLCTARNIPHVQPFTSKENESMKRFNSKHQSTEKISKKVTLLEDSLQKEIIYNQTADAGFYSGKKQNDQLFLTSMQSNINNHDFTSTFQEFASVTQTYRFTKAKGKLRTDRKWTFDEFLNNLYVEKTKDLKTKPNPKQQALFMEKFKEKFERCTKEEISVYFDHFKGNANVCGLRQIDAAGSDFGVNAIRCICEFMLSNKIIKISQCEIESFCNVKLIVLDRNPLSDEGVMILAESIVNFKMLQKLSLVSVNMSPKGSKQLLKGLMGLQHLKYVNFSSEEGLNRNRFGDSIKELQLLLSHPNCAWEEMDLSNTNIGEHGLSSISNGITQRTSLKEMVLTDNDITSEQMPYFLSKVKVCNLMRLDLANNQIGDQGFKLIVDVIGCQYGHNSFSRSLKILNLSSNQIRSYSIEHYCKNMFNNNALTELNLSCNNLSKGEQFFNFKFYISKNWTLKTLDLSNCFSNVQDMGHLFEGHEENRALMELKVTRNNFSVESFVAMAKMLALNKNLKVLELESCNITDKFVEKAQKQLREIKNINFINFNNNYLSDKSGKILLEMINKGTSITKLTFLKNCLGVKIQTQITSILKSNRAKREYCKSDQKQMEYLKYIADIQSNNQESIRQAIEKLRQKEQKVKLSSLVCEVVKVELEEEVYKRELQEQIARIKQLEQKLLKNNYHDGIKQTNTHGDKQTRAQ